MDNVNHLGYRLARESSDTETESAAPSLNAGWESGEMMGMGKFPWGFRMGMGKAEESGMKIGIPSKGAVSKYPEGDDAAERVVDSPVCKGTFPGGNARIPLDASANKIPDFKISLPGRNDRIPLPMENAQEGDVFQGSASARRVAR